MLSVSPLVKSGATFFPAHPFSIWEGDRLVYTSLPTGRNRSRMKKSSFLATMTVEGHCYTVSSDEDDIFPSFLAKTLENATTGLTDVAPIPFYYLFNSYRRSIQHELCTDIDIKTCTFPLSYVMPSASAYFTAYSLAICQMIDIYAFRPQTMVCTTHDARIHTRLVLKTDDPSLPLFNPDHFFFFLYQTILKNTDILEEEKREEDRIIYSLSAPYCVFSEEDLASPMTFLIPDMPYPVFTVPAPRPTAKSDSRREVRNTGTSRDPRIGYHDAHTAADER